jgi:hypothetical protein
MKLSQKLIDASAATKLISDLNSSYYEHIRQLVKRGEFINPFVILFNTEWIYLFEIPYDEKLNTFIYDIVGGVALDKDAVAAICFSISRIVYTTGVEHEALQIVYYGYDKELCPSLFEGDAPLRYTFYDIIDIAGVKDIEKITRPKDFTFIELQPHLLKGFVKENKPGLKLFDFPQERLN